MNKRLVSILMLLMLLTSTIPLILEAKYVEANKTGSSLIGDDAVNQVHSALDAMTHSAVTERKSDSKQEETLENSGQTSPNDRNNRGFNDASEWSNFAYMDGSKTRLIVGVNGKKPINLLEKIVAKHQAEIVNKISIKGEVRAVVVELLFASVLAFVEEIHVAGLSSYIEPNMKVQAQSVPNDPYWSMQWGPQKIEADWAWNTTVGDPSVLVAVVDTGIYYYHEDIAANYVTGGYDWANNDPDPIDDHGHGTHCAGIIAAVLNNGIGIAGLAQIQVMTEKVLNSMGGGYADWVANGIIHATDCGADIISMSLGGYGESELLHEAVKYAYDSGVLVIAAAGNDNTNMKLYPAGYDEVVSVAATDQYDNKAWFSNWGDWIELAAPGVDIFSTVPWGYESWSGTSMACPHVAGVAALAWSAFPTKTRDWVGQWLHYTADDLGDPGFDIYYGYGRVNARKAVETTPPVHELIAYDLITPPCVKPGALTIINATVVNFGESDETDVEVQLLANDTIADSTLIGLLVSGNSAAVNLLWNPTIEGLYNVTLYVVPVPEEYDIANNVKSVKVFVSTLSMALFQNWNPWGYPSNEEALERYGISYIVFSSSNFGIVDLSVFTKVVIASDQDQTFYNGMETYRWWFEDYVSNGGILEIHAADWGWNGGHWAGALPGGLQWAGYYGQYVTVIDPTHPLLTKPNIITEAELDNWNYAVHGYFSAYPPDAHVIIIEDSTSMPAYLEFGYGIGFIIASSQTLEWAYKRQLSLILENSLLYMSKRYEHDVAVSLETPRFLEPSNSVLLNATVRNLGLSNETNVKLQLLINSTIVESMVIPELLVGESYTFSHLWTPSEGIYNVTAYAPPVPNEDHTRNNFASADVRVRYVIARVAVLNSWDIPLYFSGGWSNNYQLLADALNAQGFYAQAVTNEEITDGILNFFDVFVMVDNVPNNAAVPWVIDFWSNGGGLVAFDSSICFLCYAGILPPESFGSNGYYTYWDYGTSNQAKISAEHPITAGYEIGQIIYGASGDAEYWVDALASTSAYPYYTMLVEDVTRSNRAYVSAYEPPIAGNVVHIWDYSHWSNTNLQLMILNAMEWAAARYEHDLAVSLNAPQMLSPSDSVILNTTVRNRGLNNETDVELYLLINGIVVSSTTIAELQVRESYNISYQWSPTIEGIYNVTAYAPPVENETFVKNNRATKFAKVMYPLIHPIEGQYANYTIYYVDPSTGEEIYGVSLNLTYLHYISPYQINITIWMKDPSNYTQNGWMIVNIFTRIVEIDSGIHWAGMWYPGWVETNVTIGSTINLLWGNATVVDNEVTYIGGLPIDCWEIQIEEYGYMYTFWYDKASGLWIGMWAASPYGTEYLTLTATNVPIGSVCEHDVAVTLDAPTKLPPGTSIILNATVYNTGLSNEATVTLQIVINGSIVASEVIPELASGDFYTLSYTWTPLVEGLYNVTVYAPPVLGEEYIENNVRVKIMNVRLVTVALISDHSELLAITHILDSMGVNYDIYNDNTFYSYTADLALLLQYRLVVFNNHDRMITASEHSSLESYLLSGGNLIVTGYDSLGNPDDPLLADIVRSSSVGDNTGEPDLIVVDATHPIMNGPYGSFPVGYHIWGLSSDCDAAEADVTRNAVTVAGLADGYDKIIATDTLTGGKVVYWNGQGYNDWTANTDCQAMFKNMVDWMVARREHDLVVGLEAPASLEPGDSCLLNATVVNRGLNNETNVRLHLLINGTVVSSATIPELLVDKSYTTNYLWAPIVEATYNVTAYAPSVPNENITANNLISKMINVRYAPRLLVVDTPRSEDTGALDILEYEYTLVTPAEFAIVDLYNYNVLFIGWEPGNTLVDALLARKTEIADWVTAGNGIVALSEFEEGNRWAWLPLVVSGSSGFHADTVHILNPAHPVMSGLTDTELSGWGNSYHGYFTGYDPAWEALAEGVEAGQPITLAAVCGAGRIAITDQDPDFHLYYGHEEGAGKLLRNMIEWVTPRARYTLAVYSVPSGVTFTVNSISHTTPWSETYDEGTLVSLVMPSIYTVGDARYYWNQWDDGNTSQSRTVTMTNNITLTAHFAGPYYQLTVTSLPIGIAFTIDGVPQITPYTKWLIEGSYTLEMPKTHDGYVWSHWLEDGDTNRIKTITLPGTIWTAIYVVAPLVGGRTSQIDVPPIKPELHISWAWLSTTILSMVVTVVFVRLKKKRQ